MVSGAAVSKTFQILYRNEEVHLDDHAHFKLHLIVDSHKVRRHATARPPWAAGIVHLLV